MLRWRCVFFPVGFCFAVAFRCVLFYGVLLRVVIAKDSGSQ